MNPRQFQWQLIGYCPGCKGELYYDWDNDDCNSSCSCDRHTTCRELLKKREEEDD